MGAATMVHLFEDFPATCCEHCGNADKKRELGCRHAVQAQQQCQQNGCSRTGGAREHSGENLTERYCKDNRPGNLVPQLPPAQPGFYRNKGHPSEKKSNCDWLRIVREFETFFVEHETDYPGNGK